jgi:hypothetical protein
MATVLAEKNKTVVHSWLLNFDLHMADSTIQRQLYCTSNSPVYILVQDAINCLALMVSYNMHITIQSASHDGSIFVITVPEICLLFIFHRPSYINNASELHFMKTFGCD